MAEFFDELGGNVNDLIFEFGKAKINQETRPPAQQPPAPAPQSPATSAQAAMHDTARKVGEIIASPKLWLAVLAVAGLVYVVKRRG